MKFNLRRLLIFFLIVLLSVGFGFAYDAIAGALERKSHPQPEAYAGLIAGYAAEFGVPEAVIWATVRSESDFVSSAVNGEAVGLMQLTPDRLDFVCREVLGEPTPEAGMLYDPATNLRMGTAYLSWLYQRYGMWDSVYAAWRAGTDATDAWLADPECLNDQGRLTDIPDRAVAAFVSETLQSAEMYAELYYQP